MPVNDKLLLVYRALFLVGEAIRLVKLALDKNPPPDKELELRDLLSDLQTNKDELIKLRDALEDGSIVIPPPPPELVKRIATLIQRVEQARLAGAAAGAAIALAGDAMDVLLEVMSAGIEL
jgi:hypothetical protein